MSGSRSGRRSSRRKLNRKSVLGALLGLTLTLGMFPSSMAVAETLDPTDEGTVVESTGGSSPEVGASVRESQEAPSSADPTPDQGEDNQGGTRNGETSSSAGDTEATQDSNGAADEDPITPFVVGPEQATGPYIYWEARSSASESPLIGGAIFEVQGPRTGNSNNNNDSHWDHSTAIVEDNTGQPGYLGLDLDPDPGEFQVRQVDDDDVIAGSRYRVRRQTAPAGYTLGSTNWAVTAGTSTNSNTAASGQWTGSPAGWDAGDFSFTAGAVRSHTITVNKGDLRTAITGETSINVSSTYTQGARFGLYLTSTSTSTIAQCTTNGSGQCTFTNVNASGVLWVGELDPEPGSAAALHYSAALGTLTTGANDNNGFSDRPYRYATSSLSGTTNQTVNVPSIPTTTNEWNQSSGRFANRLANPQLPLRCDAGVKVAVVLDLSGSVGGYQDDLAKATTRLVDGLTGTPSSVALFSFSTASPATRWNNGNTNDVLVANHPGLQSVQTAAEAAVVKSWYSDDGGETANFTPSGGTNWDHGLWAAAQGVEANDYDVVFVLTDGKPTFSASSASNGRSGSGSLTTFRELERAIFSSNVIKDNGARVVTVGIGDDLSDHNLSAISGPSKYVDGAGINDFDYLTADWEELEQVMRDFAQGLRCESTITVEKQAKPYGGSFTAASGWEFSLGQTGAASQSPASSSQTTGQSGQATWTLTFTHPDDEASAVLTESDSRTGWSLSDITCNVGDAEVNLSNKTATVAGIGIGENVKCTFKNEESQAGTLVVTKILDGSVPLGSGTDVTFSGTYTCTLGGMTAASGTWSRVGAGPATLSPDEGSPGANQIPVGASCSATETQPTGSDGLPNSSWEWDTYTVGPAVTIATNQTGTITVTNKAKRVYGNFQVAKVLAVGSTADTSNTYSGNWSCTLGTGASAETKTGTWGPIAAGATWTSTVSDQIPLGADCTVTSETRPDWPVADDHSHQWDGDPTFSAGVTAAKDNLGTVTVTNKTKRIVGSATWSKVDSSSSDLLAGSTWTLVGPNVPANTVVSDCTAAPCPTGAFTDQDPVAGQFKLTDLLAGGYTLTENTAPPGYRLDDTDHEFTIDADHTVIELGAIKNRQQGGATLPLTGGLGRDAFLLGGTALLLLAAGALVVRQRRARRIQHD